MRMIAVLTVAAALLGVTVTGFAESKAPAKAKPKDANTCTQVQGFVLSEAYGYKHGVRVVNGCDKPVSCEVWTDVDPSPKHDLDVAAGQTGEVITRIGSPAREFTPFKNCRYR